MKFAKILFSQLRRRMFFRNILYIGCLVNSQRTSERVRAHIFSDGNASDHVDAAREHSEHQFGSRFGHVVILDCTIARREVPRLDANTAAAARCRCSPASASSHNVSVRVCPTRTHAHATPSPHTCIKMIYIHALSHTTLTRHTRTQHTHTRPHAPPSDSHTPPNDSHTPPCDLHATLTRSPCDLPNRPMRPVTPHTRAHGCDLSHTPM